MVVGFLYFNPCKPSSSLGEMGSYINYVKINKNMLQSMVGEKKHNVELLRL